MPNPTFRPAVAALLLAAAAASPAQTAPTYRFTAHALGLASPDGSLPGAQRLLQLSESGLVYGTQLFTQPSGATRFAAYEWRNGTNRRLFDGPWTSGGPLDQPLAASETGVFLASTWARQGDRLQTLPGLPDSTGVVIASRVNDAGSIVGVRQTLPNGSSVLAPTAWQFGGTGGTAAVMAMDFPSAYRGPSTIAFTDINRVGTAAGWSVVTGGAVRATVWDASGPRLLAPLSTDPVTGLAMAADTVDISDSGLLAGSAEATNANGLPIGKRAVRWNADGSIVNLGTLSTTASGLGQSWTTAINEVGDVAGSFTQYSSSGTSLGSRGFVWDDVTHTQRALGTLGVASNGSASSSALDINAAGQVVGASDLIQRLGATSTTNRGSRATFADTGGSFVDLNTLTDPLSLTLPGASRASVLTRAVEINDRGWILVEANNNAAFLLTPTGDSLAPVPEPGRLGLLACGLALLGWRCRRSAGARRG